MIKSTSEQDDTNGAVISDSFKDKVADAMAENKKDHEDADDYAWDSANAVQIILNGSSITVNGSGATVNGSQVTITSAGTYIISGSLTNGQIVVNVTEEETVKLVFNGVNLFNSTSAPVYIIEADKTIIILADNTHNNISDGTTYTFANAQEEEPNAAIYSKSDLSLSGNGSLTVFGNFNDAIACVDGLVIKSGVLIIRAKDDGIRGKDYLVIKGGNIDVNAGGDGLKSDDAEDTARGYVLIEDGVVTITAGNDAIDAQTDALIAAGDITLTSGGGSSKAVSADVSAKGIKGIVNTIIDDGNLTINSADDAVHSNGNLAVNGGVFTITTADDGIHADSALSINDGVINITKSYEGIESTKLTINDGNIHITSSDDGINAADGSEGGGGNPGQGGGGMPAAGNNYLYINGGTIVTNATGDGYDINGSIVMTGGNVIINGPTANMNGAIDYDKLFKISGGYLVAVGSSGMAQAPGSSSTQYSLLINFGSTFQAGTLFHIQSSDGANILTFAPVKRYQSIAFSSANLKKGTTYDVYYGGSSSGAAVDGLYQDGAYTPGTKLTSFTVSSIITKLIVRQ